MAGYGSYYEFSPHQVYAGYGATAPLYDLDVDQVLADINTSDFCYGPQGVCSGDKAGTAVCKGAQGQCNFAGQRANKEIAAALNALGYGPIAVSGAITWKGAYSQFLADNGLAKGPGFGITRQALLTMKAQLDAGETPGPAEPATYKKVNGELIPTGKPGDAARAGVSTGTILLAALVVGGIGYAAYKAGKKKKGGGRATTSAMALR
jgi:hypothetical protein